MLPELRDELVAAVGRRRARRAAPLLAVAAVLAVGAAVALSSGGDPEREVAAPPGEPTVLLPPLDAEARERHGGAYEARRVRTPGGYTGFVTTGNGLTCTWGALGEGCAAPAEPVATLVGCVLPDRLVAGGYVPEGVERVGLAHRDGRPGRPHQVRDRVFRFTVPASTRPSGIDLHEPGDVDRWPIERRADCRFDLLPCPDGERAVRGVTCEFVDRWTRRHLRRLPTPFHEAGGGFHCRVDDEALCTDGSRAFRFALP